MAFDDDPIVDENAKNSAESLSFVKTLFCERNGFICRTDKPDFGVDELVELIKWNQDSENFEFASNKRFVLQLKSMERISKRNLAIKSDKEFIKISFKTSRLNYLLQYSPAYGIVVIYDVSTKTGFFDYAESIYKNLNEFHEGESWKTKDSPTIYIPFENKLDTNSLLKIHNFFSKRHENADCLFQNHGESYNIPSFKKPSFQEFDFRKTSDIIKALHNYGWALIDNNDLILLDSMMSTISHQEIINNETLCLLKATVSCEIGDHLDADYFLFKYDRLSKSSDTDLARKIFLRNKIDFILGRIDTKSFITNLEDLKNSIDDEYNKLLLDINIFFMELLQKLSSGKPDSNRFEDLIVLFEKIDKSKIKERKKHYLNTYHISNLVIFVTQHIREKFSRFKIKESMGIYVPLEERGLEVGGLIKKVNSLKDLIFATWKFGSEIKDNYLVASSMYNLANYEFVFYYNIALLNWDKTLETVGDKENFTRFLDLAFSSFDLFNKMGKIHNAYLSLVLAHELTLLYKILHNETIKNEPELIEKNIKDIQEKMGYKPFESSVRSSLMNLVNNEKNSLENFQEIDDNNIDSIVEMLCNSMDLPIDRIPYMKADIIGTKYFYANRVSNNLELFQKLDHTKDKSTYYKSPIFYSVYCKNCKNHTPWSLDIEPILKLANEHIC
jgi:uncharacterized protein YneF (UPF0154 family)